MRITSASYWRPTSCGSIKRYGTVQCGSSFSSRHFIPLAIASWWEPENAANTSLPAYGWRSYTCIRVTRSYISMISGILEKSSLGSTPKANIFIAIVIISALPVRSPLPKRVPSIRSAPASKPISESATPVPRSLCGWSDNTTFSRYLRFWEIYAIWLAYTWGMDICTVAGKLMIAFRSLVGCHTSKTALHTSKANSGSVPVKLSGEYSKR